MMKSRIVAALLITTALAACDRKPPPAAEVRPVRTLTIEQGAVGETLSLTGQVRAKDQVDLAFRIDGRMIKRLVNVGDQLTAGQVVAELDPRNEQHSLRSAEATLASAQATFTQARQNFWRQQQLVGPGWTSRAKFDEAQQNLLTAEAQVDAARAQAGLARDQLSFTVLSADAAGVVTAKGAEPGEVVKAGQMIVNVARRGGRDAVFDVPESLIRTGPRNPVVQIALTNDPKVHAVGRVREISPQADSVTRTYEVKVGIIDPPPEITLGATVTGSITLPAPAGVNVPATALTEAGGHPAVWVLDPASHSVSLRNIDVARYDPENVVVARGLEAGDIVVTAGAQTLRPGQKVRPMGAAS